MINIWMPLTTPLATIVDHVFDALARGKHLQGWPGPVTSAWVQTPPPEVQLSAELVWEEFNYTWV